MKNWILVLILFIGFIGYAQSNDNVDLYASYREDQFYASVTYNLLNDKLEGVSQNGFSSGIHFGFIRDMPVNDRRNLAIGIGVGISSNSYNQNVSILETNNNITYNIIDEDEVNVSKNKFTTYLVEVPFEFRWRTSTSTDYNFWRIYTGFKLGYLLYNSSKYKSDNGNQNLSNIDNFNNIQYGITLSAGYGTWNFHAYYGLNPIFNNVKLSERTLDISSFKIGLMFYIL
ncbi:porin family protein [Winogradskyella sp. PE311]|uniref:porin family protein n=1 Tax=Winogradskyella sp. PE311 TaxID=3366943 RepID=UPI0039815BA7